MRLFIFTMMSVLSSCVSHEYSMKEPLFDTYESYMGALKSQDYDSAVSMLTHHSQNEFYKSKSGEDFPTYFPFFSSVDTVVVKQVNYYQAFNKSKGCLTVNGYGADGEPATLNFELLNEAGEWKFKYVQIMYHESIDEFPLSPTCPPKL